MKVNNYIFANFSIQYSTLSNYSNTHNYFSIPNYFAPLYTTILFPNILSLTILLFLFLFQLTTLASTAAPNASPTLTTKSKNIINTILAEASLGELMDKITILEIKQEQIKDTKKLRNINLELESLYNTLYRIMVITPELQKLIRKLKKVNYQHWIASDTFRIKEGKQEFDAAFIELARTMYTSNDERCKIKYIINEFYGSRLIEEKSHFDTTILTSPLADSLSTTSTKKTKSSTNNTNYVTPEKTDHIVAEVSLGELVDKITILQVKQEQFKDERKLRNVNLELETLYNTLYETITITPTLENLMNNLKAINDILWVAEDDIRVKEHNQEFDAAFIALARRMYTTNDERCAIKRKINELYGSRLVEEKSHIDHALTE